MTTILDHFDSPGELIQAAMVPALAKHRLDPKREPLGDDNKEFTGTSSFDEACQHATHIWQDGIDMYEKAQGELSDVNPGDHGSILWQTRIHAEGDEVLVDRYLDNDPDCWLDPYMEQTPNGSSIIRAVFNGGASGKVSARDKIRQGLRFMQVVDALEASGMRVEIIACWHAASTGNGVSYCNAVSLKAAQDPLDIPGILFWIAHPSAQRRFAFLLRDNLTARHDGPHVDAIWRGVSNGAGYGHSKKTNAGLEADITNEALYLGSNKPIDQIIQETRDRFLTATG